MERSRAQGTGQALIGGSVSQKCPGGRRRLSHTPSSSWGKEGSIKVARVGPTSAGDKRENIRTCIVSIDQNPNLIRFCNYGYYYRKVSNTVGLEMTKTLLFGFILFCSRLSPL